MTDPEIAVEDFIRLARSPEGTGDQIQLTHFDRWMGDEALKNL